jgi:hypothetical protein
MEMDFYSARLLYVRLVDDGQPKRKNLYEETVILFRAPDFHRARQKALRLGQDRETTYRNEKGQRVRWALAEVLDVDWIGEWMDGKEVSARLHYRTTREAVGFGRRYRPSPAVKEHV